MGSDSSLGWSTLEGGRRRGGEGRREHAGSRRGEGFGRGGSGWRAGREIERKWERARNGERGEEGGGVGGGGEALVFFCFPPSLFSLRPFSPELLVLGLLRVRLCLCALRCAVIASSS